MRKTSKKNKNLKVITPVYLVLCLSSLMFIYLLIETFIHSVFNSEVFFKLQQFLEMSSVWANENLNFFQISCEEQQSSIPQDNDTGANKDGSRKFGTRFETSGPATEEEEELGEDPTRGLFEEYRVKHNTKTLIKPWNEHWFDTVDKRLDIVRGRSPEHLKIVLEVWDRDPDRFLGAAFEWKSYNNFVRLVGLHELDYAKRYDFLNKISADSKLDPYVKKDLNGNLVLDRTGEPITTFAELRYFEKTRQMLEKITGHRDFNKYYKLYLLEYYFQNQHRFENDNELMEIIGRYSKEHNGERYPILPREDYRKELVNFSGDLNLAPNEGSEWAWMAKKNRLMFQYCVYHMGQKDEINIILAETKICDLPHLEYYKLKFVSGDDYMALQDHKMHLYHFVTSDTNYLNDLAFNMGFRDEAKFYSILHKYAMEDINDDYQRRLLSEVTQFIPEDKFERFTNFNNNPTVQKLRVLFMLDEAGLIKDETLKRNLEDIARLEWKNAVEIGKLQKITAFYVREVPITDEMYRDIQEKFNVKPADLETFKKDISELRSWLHFVRIFEK